MNYAAILGLLSIYSNATGDILIDQIGGIDGGSVGAIVAENQHFEPKFSDYDIATIEKITTSEQTTINTIEFVLYGWNGFNDPSSITEFRANIYTDEDAAGASLVGDVGSQAIDAANITISSEWLGLGTLISVPTDLEIDSGDHWISVIPRNPFATDGLTGVLSSLIGDGVLSVQANPSEVYGFGPWQELSHEIAIRVHIGEANNPCGLTLPSECPEDIDGNGIVETSDLLQIIAQWGECGDGTYRPTADIAPLPTGDCCVNLTDILAVIAAWDSDCNEYGACCLSDGSCSDGMSLSSCENVGGYFSGSEMVCLDVSCELGACCFEMNACNDMSSIQCTTSGGSFEGPGTYCDLYDCSALENGDECNTALIALLGANSFDTTLMTPSTPEPDESMCEDSNLAWSNSNDVWFSYVPTQSHNHLFSLCDNSSYDTSMVLYSESCGNQIACNGDSEDSDPSCQQYFSAIDAFLNAGETYYIRIGGWLGDEGQGTLQITEIPLPIPGACCFPLGNCVDDLISDDCHDFGGEFAGEETLCSSDPCIVAVGDECADSTPIHIGSNSFDTTNATPSTPYPDESQCPDTQLNWSASPDVWMYWTATDNGIATFSTCDIDGYDTSIALYEGDCNTQVACNGDGDGESNCQQYYSLIEYQVAAGTTYYIRAGGWQGSTGTGTIQVSFIGDDDTGACCTGTLCNEALTAAICDSLGGDWYHESTCAEIICTDDPCADAQFIQEPHSQADSWFAGTSAYDPSNKVLMNRAESVMLESTNEITVWGFQLFNAPEGWSDCTSALAFNIRSYEDAKGLPGNLAMESLNTQATRIATGELYGGTYELFRWNMDFASINADHLALQSVSEGEDCWFLWMSSGIGDTLSAVNSGGGWSYDTNDLSICIH